MEPINEPYATDQEMHILFDHQIFSLQKFGGVSRYFESLIKGLIENDVDVSLFLGFHRSGHSFSEIKENASSNFGIRHPGIKLTGRVFWHVNRILFPYWRKRIAFSVYHMTYYHDFSKASDPVVVTVHDMIHELFPEYFPSNDHTSEIKAKAIRRADQIIAVSERTKQDLLDVTNISPKRVHVVYHAVPEIASGVGRCVAYSDASQEFVKPSAAARHIPYFLFVGHRGGHKNWHVILEALGKSTRLSKVAKIVCFGEPFSRIERALLRNHGLSERVIPVGGREDQLAGLYRKAVALIYPSVYEGFGLPLLEAMDLGCPVLASSGGAIPEIAGEAALYFPPNDAEALLGLMEQIVEDDELREELIATGYKRAMTFTKERFIEDTMKVYRAASDG